VTYDVWHRRLGHLSIPVYNLLTAKTSLTAVDRNHHCSICPLSKQQCLPFISKNSFSPHCFDIIHADVWGPFRYPTYDDFRYFLTLVDDKSCFTWVYLLKNKSDCIVLNPKFFQYIENHFHVNIKIFRSDNAKELSLHDFFTNKGVLHQFSCVERPEQNSVVERKHLHILNIARSLLFQSNVSINVWGDCIRTAVFLMNRTPSPALGNKSPYEILFDKIPLYSDFKVFGSLCYASTLLSSRHKFSPRATAAVFIGYPIGYKGYKLLDIKTRKTFISRDVKFHEHIFPFQENTVSTAPDIFHPVTPVFHPPNLDDDTYSLDHNLPSPTSAFPSDNNPPSPTPTPASSLDSVVPIRRSARSSNPPTYLSDYHCYNVTHNSKIPYPIQNFVNYSKLSTPYTHYLCQISENYEPQTYKQAIRFPHWQKAIDDELAAMDVNNTWSITHLPPGKKSISCKWLFKLKLNSDGTIVKHKARLVARGFTQQYGTDFYETFSAVAKITTLRIILSLAASHNWHLTQLDINNAFLNGNLNEDIFMHIPPGYTHNFTPTSNAPLVCHLINPSTV